MNILPSNDERFGRLLVLVLSGFAIAGYLVAAIKADQGQLLYEQYVQAYTACHEHVVATGAMAVDCGAVGGVADLLAAHRLAYRIGEPFLNMALVLSAILFASPLLFWLAGYIQRGLALPAAVGSGRGQRA